MTTTTQHNAQINTPTKRLSNEDIYNDIYNMVEQQVKEMLQRGGTNEFNWNNCTTYTRDILNNGMTHGWLVALWNGDKDEFADCVNNCGIDQDLANEMISNYSTYLGTYWREYKTMIKDAGFTQEVYVQRRERAKLAKREASAKAADPVQPDNTVMRVDESTWKRLQAHWDAAHKSESIS